MTGGNGRRPAGLGGLKGTSALRRLRLLVAVLALSLLAAACSSGGSSVSPVPGAGWVNGVPRAQPGRPVPTAPNIVFVLTDDLSWNLLKYMPHVRAMQRAGTTFSRYFVTDSLCCPSRTSILTGEFPHEDGVSMNAGPQGGFDAFLANSDENKTFATVLQRRGYLTGFFGKYLNLYQPRGTYSGQHPYVPPGWSAWDVPDRYGYVEFNYTMAVGRRLGTWGSDPEDYLTSVLGHKAERFITASAAAHRPFLADVSTYAPHGPFVPAPADAAKFPGLQAPRGPAFGKAVRNAPSWLAKIPPLTGSDVTDFDQAFRLRVQDVQSVDRMIGRLEAQLKRLGIARNTYFVFNSDNGLHLGEHDLRLGKRTAFDTDIRTPLVVTGPGVPRGRTVSDLTSNIDLAPTFESMAGAVPPSTVDGRSLLGFMHGRQPIGWRNAVLVEHHGPDVQMRDPDYQAPEGGNPPSYEAIRTERYLYVEYVNGDREFYDLQTDPAELDNRYATMAKSLRTQLHDTVRRLATCHGSRACWDAQHLVALGGG